MATIRYAFIICIVLFLSINLYAQEVDNQNVIVNSLENVSENVNVELDYPNDKIKLTLFPSEVLCINGYRGIFENIKILGGKFVVLSFGIRGGTGVALGKTILVCVSKGHLYNALDILSKQIEEFTKTYNEEVDAKNLYDEHHTYKVTLVNLENDKKDGYKLTCTVYDMVKSKHDPTTNHESLDTLHFSFDEESKVFYNQYIALKGNYLLGSSPTSKQKFFKGGKYPEIKLRNDEYVFIDGTWYTKFHENHLIVASDSCN